MDDEGDGPPPDGMQDPPSAAELAEALKQIKFTPRHGMSIVFPDAGELRRRPEPDERERD